MSEFNIEGIIKALEWCIQSEDCEYCEYNKGNIDVCSIKSDALTLIKQLAEDNKWSAKRIIEADKMVLQLNTENERLMQDKTALECIVATARNQAKTEVVREILEKIDKIIDKHYNKHIFGNNDLEDEEKEAVINFSDDVTYDIDKLKEEYKGDQI